MYCTDDDSVEERPGTQRGELGCAGPLHVPIVAPQSLTGELSLQFDRNHSNRTRLEDRRLNELIFQILPALLLGLVPSIPSSPSSSRYFTPFTHRDWNLYFLYFSLFHPCSCALRARVFLSFLLLLTSSLPVTLLLSAPLLLMILETQLMNLDDFRNREKRRREVSTSTNQVREPFPYFLGWENQTASWAVRRKEVERSVFVIVLSWIQSLCQVRRLTHFEESVWRRRVSSGLENGRMRRWEILGARGARRLTQLEIGAEVSWVRRWRRRQKRTSDKQHSRSQRILGCRYWALNLTQSRGNHRLRLISQKLESHVLVRVSCSTKAWGPKWKDC